MIQCHFCKFIEEKLVMVVLFICFSVLISVLSILFTAFFFLAVYHAIVSFLSL